MQRCKNCIRLHYVDVRNKRNVTTVSVPINIKTSIPKINIAKSVYDYGHFSFYINYANNFTFKDITNYSGDVRNKEIVNYYSNTIIDGIAIYSNASQIPYDQMMHLYKLISNPKLFQTLNFAFGIKYQYYY